VGIPMDEQTAKIKKVAGILNKLTPVLSKSILT
jgi:hypothetical protein